MAMVVKNNMSAINTLNTMTKNNSALGKSIQKLSSGMKINGAADDVAGYAISEKMRVQIILSGGEVYFQTRMDKLIIENDSVKGIETNTGKVFQGFGQGGGRSTTVAAFHSGGHIAQQ